MAEMHNPDPLDRQKDNPDQFDRQLGNPDSLDRQMDNPDSLDRQVGDADSGGSSNRIPHQQKRLQLCVSIHAGSQQCHR